MRPSPCARDGYATIMVNCNPGPQSVRSNTFNRPAPVSPSDAGIVRQFQRNAWCRPPASQPGYGAPIIGTTPDMIDAAEDRERFQKPLATWARAAPTPRLRTEADSHGEGVRPGYLLPARPSYVLGGRAMETVHEQRDLERCYAREAEVKATIARAAGPFPPTPSSATWDHARRHGRVFIGGVMEHIEQAGAHSGDCPFAAAVLTKCRDGGRDQAPHHRHGPWAERVVGLMNVCSSRSRERPMRAT